MLAPFINISSACCLMLVVGFGRLAKRKGPRRGRQLESSEDRGAERRETPLSKNGNFVEEALPLGVQSSSKGGISIFPSIVFSSSKLR